MERLASKDPSGIALAALVEKRVNEGDLDGAYELAEQGIREFPASARLGELYGQLRFERKKKELDRELDALPRNRQPQRYVHLATLYRELGDEDRAIRLLDEGIERFPQSDGCFLAQGEIRLERFRKSKGEEEGAAAEKRLEEAARLNTNPYRALLLLGRLHEARGNAARVKEVVERIFAIVPGDEAARALLASVEAAARGDLLSPVAGGETARAPAGIRGRVSTRNVDHLALVEALARFDRLAGLVAALLVDGEGQVVGSRLRGETEEALAGAVVGVLASRIRKAVEGMSLGVVEEGVLEGERGSLYLAPAADLALGVLVDAGAKPGFVDAVIKEYLRDAKNPGRAQPGRRG